MSRPHYKTLEDVPSHVRREYAAHRYLFSAPPVTHSQWAAVDWINYVRFTHLNYDTHEVNHYES